MGKIKVAAWSMGFVLLVGSPIVSAIGFSEVAVAEVVAVDQRKVEADQLIERGNQQFAASQFDAAFQSWQNALKLYRELKDQLGESNAIGNLGIAYRNLGNYPKAIEFQEQRLAIAREIKDRLGEGQSLGNLGNAYYSLSNYPKAIDHYQQAVVVIETTRQENRKLTPALQASYTKTVTKTYQNLANLLISQGRPAEAQKVLDLLKR